MTILSILKILQLLQIAAPAVHGVIADLRAKGHPDDAPLPPEHEAAISSALAAVRIVELPPTPMSKGTLVSWVTSSDVHGSGVTITDQVDGHILVACDAPQGQEHRVIWCAVTWLTGTPMPAAP